MKTTILWLRNDLRLVDNPALVAAAAQGAVVPVYIYSPEEEGNWPIGGASKWWLHHSLESLQKDFAALGIKLILKRGNTLEVLKNLIAEVKADAVFWSRRYEPYAINQSAKVKSEFQDTGIECKSFNSSLLFEPIEVANKQGKPFQVFTPFWKTIFAKEAKAPLPAPKKIEPYVGKVSSEKLEDFALLPRIHWDEGIAQNWKCGEKAALEHFKTFLNGHAQQYAEDRDIPALKNGVSHLSPYLHFGEISPRYMWEQLKGLEGVEPYMRQLGWREFAHHLLYHFSYTIEKPLRPDYANFPWAGTPEMLKAWQKGKTGYPFVDAGMRELWVTGWMHNRVRLVVGSFLVKHLLINWIEGDKWFWDTLVDADMANNTMGWQWIAGCGADAAPYFRIFNPVTQGEKFDPDGEYVKKWCPELSGLSKEWIHKPWEAPSQVLRAAGVEIGTTYPKPIVDHHEAREKALAALSKISYRD